MIMRNVMTALFAAGAAGCAAFLAGYLRGSHGWWRSDTGRNLMAMMFVLACLLGLVVVNRLVGVPIGVWLFLLCLLDTVIWWRVIILWRRQHERNRS